MSRALVTGGGSGIGAAIAAALDADGFELVLVGRDATKLERVASAFDAVTAVCDVTDEHAVVRLAAELNDVDVLVNNAGAAEAAPLTRTSLALWQRMIDANATSTFLLCRAFAWAMAERRSGRIVNIASTAGERGYPYSAAYCASKHAVVGLTRALALELAPVNVTVNAVCPGWTETPLLERALAGIVAATGRDEAAARKALLDGSAQDRFVRPDEVAAVVAWLCAPAQASVTGQALMVAAAEAV